MTAWKRNVPAVDNATGMYQHKRFFFLGGGGAGCNITMLTLAVQSSQSEPWAAILMAG